MRNALANVASAFYIRILLKIKDFLYNLLTYKIKNGKMLMLIVEA